MTVEKYLKKPYSRVVIPEADGGYYAEILEFPGCRAYGETPAEAYERLESAAESWIIACLDTEKPVPEPFEDGQFNGKVALRLPRSVHRQAVRAAERDGTSLNQFLLSAVAERIGASELYSTIAKKLESRFAVHLELTVSSQDAATPNSLPDAHETGHTTQVQ
jgi:predicted RNase H-like HicB family nuclease